MNNNLKKLAIGTAQFGMNYGIANKNGIVKSKDINAILDLAWKKGIHTLDTAKSYGNSEEIIGDYIDKVNNGPWNIITKLSSRDKTVFDQIQDSIDKLNIKPIAVMAHSADLFLDSKFQRELIKAKNKNNVQKIGVSLYSEKDIDDIIHSALIPDVIQLPLNILDTRLYKRKVISQLFEIGIEIHVRSVFLQGLFYLPKNDLETNFGDAMPYIDVLSKISNNAGLTLPELSLLWLISLHEISKVIVGVDNVTQLKIHINSINKEVDDNVFKDALKINCNNEKILNPSLWQ
jgi:aryl-alcohol dehydrogenase-like predicted oxidoreductase